MIDVVIPAHEKDIDTLGLTIEHVKKNVENLRDVYVVSRENLSNEAKWIPETSFSFSLENVASIVGNGFRTSWYYAMLLKILAATEIPNISDTVVIMESDTMLLKPTKFIENNNISLHSVSYDSNPPNNSYCEHLTKLLPDFKFDNNYSGIVHHAVVQRDILENIIEKVETLYNKPFWRACLEVTTQSYTTNPNHVSTGLGCGKMADYELLFHYPNYYFKDRVRIRPLRQIMAYKSNYGVEGFDNLDYPERTNLWGDQHIFSNGEDKNFNFGCIRESMAHISSLCEQLGWDTVTFQAHSRLGSSPHREIVKESLQNRLNLSNKE